VLNLTRELDTLTAFRSAGLVVCVAVGVQPLAWVWFTGPFALPYLGLPMVALARTFIGVEHPWLFGLVVAGHLAGMVLFMLAFARCTAFSRPDTPRATAVLLAVQIGLGLLIEAELLYVVAAELALILPWRQALVWLGAQASALVAVGLWRLARADGPLLFCNVSIETITPPSPDQLMTGISLSIVLGLLFQTAAFTVGRLASSERQRRARIAAARAGLSATRQLLLDAVRASERLRVARELHDAVGHQLTAINLHLELALRQSGESPPAALYAACKLAKHLSADLRRVVRDEAASRKEQA
jgi:signal transduction histidine kinase